MCSGLGCGVVGETSRAARFASPRRMSSACHRRVSSPRPEDVGLVRRSVASHTRRGHRPSRCARCWRVVGERREARERFPPRRGVGLPPLSTRERGSDRRRRGTPPSRRASPRFAALRRALTRSDALWIGRARPAVLRGARGAGRLERRSRRSRVPRRRVPPCSLSLAASSRPRSSASRATTCGRSVFRGSRIEGSHLPSRGNSITAFSC